MDNNVSFCGASGSEMLIGSIGIFSYCIIIVINIVSECRERKTL